MKKLLELSQQIQHWNYYNQEPLPTLSLVLIITAKHTPQLNQILRQFQCQCISSQSNQYEHKYRINNGIIGELFLIDGLADMQIRDVDFKIRKKVIEKYRRKRQVIFVLFSKEELLFLSEQKEHLQEFGFMPVHADRNVIYEHSIEHFCEDLVRTYENLFKFKIANSYLTMKSLRKQYIVKTQKYQEWKQILDGKIDSLTYSLLCFKNYSQTMKCSFSGIYLPTTVLHQSINWKVMELLKEFWAEEGEQLLKQIDSMPLSYIEQEYKMSDYYSIGGFLSDQCFRTIFSPPLHQFKQRIMDTLQTLKYLVLNHVQLCLAIVFQHVNILPQLIEEQVANIQRLCDEFVEGLEKNLQSQIQYLHADGADFWNFRQLNSNIYSPDQQIYIEIKYIGKAYVRKVYDGIKESVPRYTGQNLLKKIAQYFTQKSLNTLIQITKENPFKLCIPEKNLKVYEREYEDWQRLQELLKYWSVKVNSSFFIKRFHERKEKQWKRMFGKEEAKVQVKEQKKQQGQERGLLAWMKKKLFKNNANSQRKKYNSGEKNMKTSQLQQQQAEDKKSGAINQKNWLLIINTGKTVTDDKIWLSATEGFPSRFRSSIWMYLSTRAEKYKKIKVADLLNSQKIEQNIIIQVEKDVRRTPPSKLFRGELKQILTRVLYSYSIYDKEIGYTQGMNFLAGIAILVLIGYGWKEKSYVQNRKIQDSQIEDKAFCILQYLMEEKGVRKLMLINPTLLTDLFLRLDKRIRDLSPTMSELISSSQFQTEMLFSGPLLSCLTSSQIDYNLQLRVFDVLMVSDFQCIYKIIAQFVARSQFKIHKLNNDNMYDYLRNQMYDEIYTLIEDDGLTTLLRSI